jgi:lactate permease
LNSWVQNYNPFHNAVLSTAIAILPTGLLFYLLAVRKTKPHIAGFSSAMLAIGIAVLAAGMPVRLALASFAYGAVFGWLPISWIVLNGMFLYNLTVETGQFEVMKESVGAISPDRRIQAQLIAFSFGAFIEGAAGFGTLIAICSALLVGLGFHPFYAAVLCLIANTSPVSFGSLGIPTITLAAVTNLPLMPLSQLTGRILFVVSILVPFWLVRTMCSWRQTLEVLPAILVAGLTFAATKLYISNFHGPYLVDIISGAVSLILMVLFLRAWRPSAIWRFPHEDVQVETGKVLRQHPRKIASGWTPFAILTVMVLLWGTPAVNRYRSSVSIPHKVVGSITFSSTSL